MDLARELSELREHVEWPPTPDLRRPVLEPRGIRRGRRRVVALGLAFAALAAVAAAFAVPSSRGAILRFFHLGAATIVRVDRLPSAEERPLSTGIGPVITLTEAKKRFPGTLLLPPLDPIPPAHLSGPAVSFLFSYHGEPVLLTEFAIGPGFMKKFAGSGTTVEGAGFDGSPALFISGDVHDFFFPGTSPRLAGNVLLWERQRATYRLESRSLTKNEAVALARSLTRG
jgi:hypothetical protein